MISGRHIRHDWQTFVDWEQKSVRTLCGSTTRRGLAGIPGVTLQGELVRKGDKDYWGWCTHCVRKAMLNIGIMDDPNLNEAMLPFYVAFFEVIGPQSTWITKRGLRAARQAETDGVD